MTTCIFLNPARQHECAFELLLPLEVKLHPFPDTDVASPGWMIYGSGRKVSRLEPYEPLSDLMWLPLRKFVFQSEAERCFTEIVMGRMDLQGLISWVSDVH